MGYLPRHVAQEARAQGVDVLLIALRGITDPDFAKSVSATVWIKPGQMERAIATLKSHDITTVVMAGKVEKRNLLRPWNLGLDRRALKMIRKAKDWRDDTLLAAIAAEFQHEGITVDAITRWANKLMAPVAILGKFSPTDEQWKDVEFGRTMAQGIGALDIGQTVIVKNSAVLAAEAIEGTDRAIRRVADLGIADGVVVKMAKPSQDMRFDVPGVGPTTIDSMERAGARVLAVEAGKTLMANVDEMIPKADGLRIAVVGIPPHGPVRCCSAQG
jgi:hypothetical protein